MQDENSVRYLKRLIDSGADAGGGGGGFEQGKEGVSQICEMQKLLFMWWLGLPGEGPDTPT